MLLENKDHVIQLRPQLNHVLEFLADFILSYDFQKKNHPCYERAEERVGREGELIINLTKYTYSRRKLAGSCYIISTSM